MTIFQRHTEEQSWLENGSRSRPATAASSAAISTVPASGKGPGIVLCQEIFGINAYVREVADYYAEEGYVVLAPDLFWRMEQGRRPRLHAKRTCKKAFDFFQRFDVDKGMDDITAAVKTLRARPEVAGKIGALGFCLGGKLAYLAAARSGVDVAVGYYGVGIESSSERAAQVPDCAALRREGQVRTARSGGEDQSTRFKDRHDVEIYVYPGQDHAFARTGGDHYDKPSALMAHHRSIAAFRRVMGPHYDFSALWDTHCMHEFGTRDVDATMKTMVAQPYVNHIPTMTGGVGHDQLKRFYKYHFIPTTPSRHQADSDLAHHRRGHPGRRDAVLLHARHRDRLDAAGRRSPPASTSRSRWWPSSSSAATSCTTSTSTGTRPRCWCRSALLKPDGLPVAGDRDGAQARRREAAVEYVDEAVGGVGGEGYLETKRQRRGAEKRRGRRENQSESSLDRQRIGSSATRPSDDQRISSTAIAFLCDPLRSSAPLR